MKKIIHIDMDAFYASVEQRDNPSLRGKPVAVGGSAARGVVAAASYEARKFGVRSAMPSRIARQQCPGLIFIKPRFEVYREVSRRIRRIFMEYTDLVEPLSLDEAYLDVTSNKKGMPSATLIAMEIRKRIREETGLTASAGVSINKFLAKTASDVKKPDGLFVITPDKAEEFVEKLPVGKFFGIGKVTAGKMHDMGIRTGLDLKKFSEMELVSRFGKPGHYYYQIARARDLREVNPHRIRKSIGAENTFAEDLDSIEKVIQRLEEITDILMPRITKAGARGKTLTVKIKYADFQQITRAKTVNHWISEAADIKKIWGDLIIDLDMRMGIRLLGLTLSNLYQENKSQGPGPGAQLTLNL